MKNKQMKLIITFTIIIAFCLNSMLIGEASAQQGISFAELSERLDPYFARELITDVFNQLPQGSDYSIWGWDVGDYSGDGYYDLAFSVRLAAEKRKLVQVYLFVDIDGYLVKVGKYPYEFVGMPLEIGVVIRSNACFVTRKREQYNWLIRGYRFENGSLVLLDEFTTKKEGIYTLDTYKNYRSLTNSVKYYKTNGGEIKFNTKFLTIPSYNRGRQIYKGYSNEILCNDVDFVPKGAYYWSGDEDASYVVSSSYDEQYLYMTLKFNDDVIVTQSCDTCISDYAELWLDVIPAYSVQYDRFTFKKDKKIQFRSRADIGIYCFTVRPGDFLRKPATVEISTTDDLETFQKIAAKNIKVVSGLIDGGFVMKFRIPFSILGFDENPCQNGDITEFGASVVYHDCDNQFRPEEETILATSAFDYLNPSTYGSLLFIPNDAWYGEASNIYKDEIIKTLMDSGF